MKRGIARMVGGGALMVLMVLTSGCGTKRPHDAQACWDEYAPRAESNAKILETSHPDQAEITRRSLVSYTDWLALPEHANANVDNYCFDLLGVAELSDMQVERAKNGELP